jgi:hypothetical protein
MLAPDGRAKELQPAVFRAAAPLKHMADQAKAKSSKRSLSPVPAHANAEAHAKVMQWLKAAEPRDVMALSVKAGVYNRKGELTAHYKPGKR